MTDDRYARALEPTLAWLALEHRGWGVVISPPSEQREIAASLARAWPERDVVLLDGDTPREWFASRPGAVVTLAPGLADDARAAVLTMLNGQRDRTSDQGVWALVVSARELGELRRHAPDLASVLRSVETVAFVPRELTADELHRARAELHAYYQRRFGRLDLRGFIRSEQEDVSFAVEEVFQPLQATALSNEATRQGAQVPRSALLVDQLAEVRRRQEGGTPGAALVVGGPGSGKSFFLRWCALRGSHDASFLGVERPVPLYVPLAAMRASSASIEPDRYALETLLDADLAIAHAVAAEADAGRAMFLLDGLDEVGERGADVAAAVGALIARYPKALVVTTSRPAGLAGLPVEVARFDLVGLDDEHLRSLLATWCELYEVHRVGPSGAARGRATGDRLASDVLDSPTLAELARVPLLATILAIVHRAGVRLPDHRVELYEHVMRILVERWNQLRSHDVSSAPPPIRIADAIRLLGPAAYEMVESGRDGAIDEATLRELLARQLARGAVRTVASADEAIAVFRSSLGLLVEQAPGVYAFLHKTLAEFLAAHDLVRTGALERILGPETCFAPRWREVILLALGIIGTLQANDDRLRASIDKVLDNASIKPPHTPSNRASLLAAITADDPTLTPAMARALCKEGLAEWKMRSIAGDAIIPTVSAWQRVFHGPWGAELGDELRKMFADGFVDYPVGDDDRFQTTLLFPLLDHIHAPTGSFECEFLISHLLSKHPEGILFHFRDGISAEEVARHAFKLSPPTGSAIVSLIRHGASEILSVIDPRTTTIDVLRVLNKGSDVVVYAEGSGPRQFIFAVQSPPPAHRKRLTGSVLAAWHEIAATCPYGPKAPANVEEAIARYGRELTAET